MGWRGAGGRAALTLAAVVTLSSCSELGLLGGAGFVAGAGSEVVVEAEAVERPPVRKIFRDGRYRFRPMPPTEMRAAERAVTRDPIAEAGTEKLVGKLVVDPKKPHVPIRAVALVMADIAVEDPFTWEGFVRGFSEDADQVREGTLAGTETVFGTAPIGSAFAMNYARDLIVVIYAGREMPQSDVKALARYLLRARA